MFQLTLCSSRTRSPYTLSYGQQVWLCLWRCIKRLKADPSLTITQFIGNAVMALIIGSVFYNLKDDSEHLFQRGAVIFFAILLNAFGSALEVCSLPGRKRLKGAHGADLRKDPNALRPTSHCRKTHPLCLLPPQCRSHRQYVDRHPVQGGQLHHIQRRALLHDQPAP
ncbi:ABC-2 type transporter [Macrophomina phaseolina MS6]|uniref:ABC-2 type transporter n=1 Tax=Macrophomina phaseolina (strain MS6) TaxID=1126212 RepID=K2RHS2_MACPH|nr:ABC-2 type transporter [Macrophomina phaseolina MS6]